MMRLSSLVVCATILACAMAQSATTSTVPQPTPTTGPPVTTEPSVSTEPPPSKPYEYVFRDDNGKACIRMMAKINVKFVYENKTSKTPMNYGYNLTAAKARVDDSSHCPTKLVLSFDPPGDVGDPNYVTFNFMKVDNNAWTSETVEYNFIVTVEEFPDSEYIGSNLTYTSTNKLLDGNVDLEGSYKCNSNEEIKFNSSATDHKVDVTLEIRDLQVQAYFNGGKETFDTATECPADGSKGNKIVPIAVGAALAGLVIVVLIAYLIGRLKSRRQSSYEALS